MRPDDLSTSSTPLGPWTQVVDWPGLTAEFTPSSLQRALRRRAAPSLAFLGLLLCLLLLSSLTEQVDFTLRLAWLGLSAGALLLTWRVRREVQEAHARAHFMGPVTYTLTDDELRIDHRHGSLRVALSDITHLRLYSGMLEVSARPSLHFSVPADVIRHRLFLAWQARQGDSQAPLP